MFCLRVTRMKNKKSNLKRSIRKVMAEANGFDDDEMFPEEIRQFMSDEEKEERAQKIEILFVQNEKRYSDECRESS